MGVFCDRLKFGSTAALDCGTGQNKGRYCEKELLLLLISLINAIDVPSVSICSANAPQAYGDRNLFSKFLSAQIFF